MGTRAVGVLVSVCPIHQRTFHSNLRSLRRYLFLGVNRVLNNKHLPGHRGGNGLVGQLHRQGRKAMLVGYEWFVWARSVLEPHPTTHTARRPGQHRPDQTIKALIPERDRTPHTGQHIAAARRPQTHAGANHRQRTMWPRVTAAGVGPPPAHVTRHTRSPATAVSPTSTSTC